MFRVARICTLHKSGPWPSQDGPQHRGDLTQKSPKSTYAPPNCLIQPAIESCSKSHPAGLEPTGVVSEGGNITPVAQSGLPRSSPDWEVVTQCILYREVYSLRFPRFAYRHQVQRPTFLWPQCAWKMPQRTSCGSDVSGGFRVPCNVACNLHRPR